MSFYKMYRGWKDNPVFKSEPYTEREAFEWIIETAAFKHHRVRIGHDVIDLRRGQAAFSMRYAGAKWQWSKSRVARFIAKLARAKMIEKRDSDHIAVTVLSVCNYALYQDDIRLRPPLPGRPGDSAGTKIKKGKEDKINNGILLVFRQATAEIFGAAAVPPFFPTDTDRVIAARLAGAGVTAEVAYSRIKSAQISKFRTHQPPINSLRYFEKVFAGSVQISAGTAAATTPENEAFDIKLDHLRTTGQWLPAWGARPETINNIHNTSRSKP